MHKLICTWEVGSEAFVLAVITFVEYHARLSQDDNLMALHDPVQGNIQREKLHQILIWKQQPETKLLTQGCAFLQWSPVDKHDSPSL